MSRTTLEDVLECVICMDDVDNAHLCPLCSKIACLKCWEQIVPRYCPNCRGDLRNINLIRCYWIADLGNCVKKLQLESEKERIRKAQLENELVNIRTKLESAPGPSGYSANPKTPAVLKGVLKNPKPKVNSGPESSSIPPLTVRI